MFCFNKHKEEVNAPEIAEKEPIDTPESRIFFMQKVQRTISKQIASGRKSDYMSIRTVLQDQFERPLTSYEKCTLTSMLTEASGFMLTGLKTIHPHAMYMGEYKNQGILNGRKLYFGPGEAKAWFHDGDWIFGEINEWCGFFRTKNTGTF